MIKTIALWTYRVIYCSVVALLLVFLIYRLPIDGWLRPFEIPLFYVFIVSAALALFTAAAFTRLPEWLSWTATLLLCVLFIWYQWFSLDAPSVLHELHTFDPVEGAKEIRAYRNHSLIVTAAALGFFMLLPVLHHVTRRRKLQV